MGALEKLSRKSGVIVGDDVLHLFEYAREKGFAIPAIVSFPGFMCLWLIATRAQLTSLTF